MHGCDHIGGEGLGRATVMPLGGGVPRHAFVLLVATVALFATGLFSPSEARAQELAPPALPEVGVDHFIVMVDDSGDMNFARRAAGDLVVTALENSSQALPGVAYTAGEDYVSVVFFSLLPCSPSWAPDRLFRSGSRVGFRRFSTGEEARQAVDLFVREAYAEYGDRFPTNGFSPIATAPAVVIPYLGERIPMWLSGEAGPERVGRVVRIVITNGIYNFSTSPAGEVSNLRYVAAGRDYCQSYCSDRPCGRMTQDEAGVIARLRQSSRAFDDSAAAEQCFLARDRSQWLGCGSSVYAPETSGSISLGELDRAFTFSYSELRPRSPGAGLMVSNRDVRLHRYVSGEGDLFLAAPDREINRLLAVGGEPDAVAGQFSIRPLSILAARRALPGTLALLPTFDSGTEWQPLSGTGPDDYRVAVEDAYDFPLTSSGTAPPDQALAAVDGHVYYVARLEMRAPSFNGVALYPFPVEDWSPVADIHVTAFDAVSPVATEVLHDAELRTRRELVTDSFAVELAQSTSESGDRWPLALLAERQRDRAREDAAQNRADSQSSKTGLGVALVAVAIFAVFALLFYWFVLRLDLRVVGLETGTARAILDFNWRAQHQDRDESLVRIASFAVQNKARTLFHRSFHLSARFTDLNGSSPIELWPDRGLLMIETPQAGLTWGAEVEIDRRARAGAHRYIVFLNPSAIKDINLPDTDSAEAYVPMTLEWEVEVLSRRVLASRQVLRAFSVRVALDVVPEVPTPVVNGSVEEAVTHRDDQEVVAGHLQMCSGANFRCSRRARLHFNAQAHAPGDDPLKPPSRRVRFSEASLLDPTGRDLLKGDGSDPSPFDAVAVERGVGFKERLTGTLLLDTQGPRPGIPNPREEVDHYRVSVRWEAPDA